MATRIKWQYDELKQIGKDYNDIAEVEAYDNRHSEVRDVKAENDKILDVLSIEKQHTLIEIGTGTGAFSIQAAEKCRKVYAIDVSKVMLEYAQNRAKKAKQKNIEFHHGGFLTYHHNGDPVDFVVSSLALHHLPDFWKQTALQKIHAILKPGGKLYLFDVIYPNENTHQKIAEWLDVIEETSSREFAEDLAVHIRDEHSTVRWIMEGLLERAGFSFECLSNESDLVVAYLCQKT